MVSPGDDSLYSPFMAAKHGLEGEKLLAFLEKFNRQSASVRGFITSMDAYAAVKSAVDTGSVPAEYAVAFAKIVAFMAFDEVQSSQVPKLLAQLGIPPAQVSVITKALDAVLRPLKRDVSGAPPAPSTTQPSMRPLPPLTQRLSTPAVPQNASRNVVNLKDTPQT